MVIFHSYVKLPEGTVAHKKRPCAVKMVVVGFHLAAFINPYQDVQSVQSTRWTIM